jgi:aerobic carbon-monoxide dehydrogenase small subunit
MSLQQVTLQVNGVAHEISVSPDALLLDVLHDQLGFTDVRYGCGEGVCGTCTVLLDGEAVSGCLVYAVQVEFREITTLAGLLAEDESLHPLQETFLRLGATQCGFCTPGVILTAYSLAERVPRPTREQVRSELGGSLCRCTGYTKILDAIESYLDDRALIPEEARS